MHTSTNNQIGTGKMIGLTLGSIANLSGLAVLMQNGYSSLFIITFIMLSFFLPSVFVVSELASTWPKEGIYGWIKLAFGVRQAFIVSFIMSIASVIYLCVSMAYAGGLLAGGLGLPQYADNAWYIFTITIAAIWFGVIFNWFGLRYSGMFALISLGIGYFLPILLLVAFAILWVVSGQTINTPMTLHNLYPIKSIFTLMSVLGVTMFLISGIEYSGVYIQHMKNKKAFTKAMIISTLIIFGCPLLCIASLLILLPMSHTQAQTAILDAFMLMIHHYDLKWLIDLSLILIFLSGLIGLSTIMISSAKILIPCCDDGILPQSLTKKNKYGAPGLLLIILSTIATLVTLLYLFIPSLNTAFQLIFVILAITVGSRYFWIFGAAIKLRYKFPTLKRNISIPGGKLGVWVISGLGFLITLIAIITSFSPLESIKMTVTTYEVYLIAGCVLVFGIPFVIASRHKHNS